SDLVFELTVLSNGNYVVTSPLWDNGTATDAGAVTWGSGTTGIVGVVSSANSLVGSSTMDGVGTGTDGDLGVRALSNGNYVVASPFWDNGTAIDAGAVTWGSGTTGVSGLISSTNSLVGSSPGDAVGYHTFYNPIFDEADFVFGLTVLSNGNYVVTSPQWDNGAAADAGAVTWGSGST